MFTYFCIMIFVFVAVFFNCLIYLYTESVHYVVFRNHYSIGVVVGYLYSESDCVVTLLYSLKKLSGLMYFIFLNRCDLSYSVF